MVHAAYLIGGSLFSIACFVLGCFLGKIVGHDRGYRDGERDGRRPSAEQLTSLRLQLASMKAERDAAIADKAQLVKNLTQYNAARRDYGEFA